MFGIFGQSESFAISKIYWTDDDGKKIFNANADGSDIQDLGITGIDLQSDDFSFHPNVSAIIKAIMLLSIDDSDLYDKF